MEACRLRPFIHFKAADTAAFTTPSVQSAVSVSTLLFNSLTGPSHFPRYIAPAFLQYICEQPELKGSK
jgi:hypothetical protein